MNSVCIVLVNYKGHNDTVECIESVLKSSHGDLQIVVVDNSPSEESLQYLEAWARGNVTSIETQFPNLVKPLEQKPLAFKTFSESDFASLEQVPTEKILFVKAKQNMGFAAGNNIAIRYFKKTGRFDFLWLLNNDTVIGKDTLSSLLQYAGHQPEKVGMIGGKLLQYYHPEKLQAVGGRYLHWFGKVREIGANESDEGQWDQVKVQPDYIIGASIFVRKEFILSVGQMEEDYFIYFEELDWALRGKAMGWSLGFCPGATVYHKLGASTGSRARPSEISDYYYIRNRILIARKFYPLTQIILYPAFTLYVVRRLIWGMPGRIRLLWQVLWRPTRHYREIF